MCSRSLRLCALAKFIRLRSVGDAAPQNSEPGLAVRCHYTYITKFQRNIVCWTHQFSRYRSLKLCEQNIAQSWYTWMGDRLENNEVIRQTCKFSIYPVRMKKALKGFKKVLGGVCGLQGLGLEATQRLFVSIPSLGFIGKVSRTCNLVYLAIVVFNYKQSVLHVY
jgi:hypothetical protein